MKEVTSIIYIKNGIEKNVNLNFLNKNKILKKIYKYDPEDKKYVIRNDIEFVHFKNFFFRSINSIESNDNSICILENCSFDINEYHGLKISGGNFQLIDPLFLREFITVKLKNLNTIDINFTKERLNDKEKGLEVISYGNKINSINISDMNNIYCINVSAKKVSLNNNFNLKHLDIIADKLIIGSNKSKTKIISQLFCINLKSKELSLKKSEIESIDNTIMIHAKKIMMDDYSVFKLDSRHPYYFMDLIVNNNRFSKGMLLEIRNKDLLRANILSVIKCYEDKIVEEISNRIDGYTDNDYSRHYEEESLINNKICELNREINYLEEEKEQKLKQIEEKKEQINRSLSNKPIKKLSKKKEKN